MKEDSDLQELLKELDCLQLYETFSHEEIKADLVLTLDKDDLSAMGIKVGIQKRFIQARKKYEEEYKSEGKWYKHKVVIYIIMYFLMYHFWQKI